IICFSFSAAVFAAAFLLPFSFLFPFSGILLLFGVLVILTRRKWVRPLALSLIAAAIGLAWFAVHDLFTVVRARELHGTTQLIHATVLDYPLESSHYCRVTVSAEHENGRTLDALVYDNTMSLAAARPGDRVSFEAKITSADMRYGKAYDVYIARDIYLKLNTRSEAVWEHHAGRWEKLPVRIQHALIERIHAIFPEDCTAFMKSLMLGDKSDLYRDEELYYSLSRAGNMHALAVSGLHIAFLVGMIQLLFGKSPFGSILCIVLVWCFVLITGASPSAVRAAVMQTLLLLAPVLRRENDPPTTISFALALILLQNPRAAASVSLQLSFAAMAGILCFGKKLYGLFMDSFHKGPARKLLAVPISAASSSLAVLPFTVPLMALHFGYFSLLAPVTSILCCIAISLCFCGGYLSCILSLLLFPLGSALALPTAWLARYIAWISGVIKDVPYSVFYTDLPWCGAWLTCVYLLFILFRFLPVRRGAKLLLPTAAAILSMLLLLNLTRIRYEKADGWFTALDVGQGQCLCAMSGEQTVLIDCGSQSSLDNVGELAGRYLISRGRAQVDALILTHTDTDHVNGVSMLMEMLPIERIVVPIGAKEDNGYLPAIREKAEQKGIEVFTLDSDKQLSFDGMSVDLCAPLNEGELKNTGLFASVHYGSYDILITGDASSALERRYLKHAEPSNCELLIVGHHGSKNSSCPELLESCGADTAIISVGYNTYGHPTQETLERLADCGYNVYRTDEDADIEIYIEDGHGEKER
ncbi:MAG: DNA internalization-related competence protein ComEC/Rec2, partial [Oscillospiraceae bacterium]|nr:DNA internalization-related competence protein ComEC/Rec2 [Oscillospiraceae bacterium]